jgi:hypothetical protein
LQRWRLRLGLTGLVVGALICSVAVMGSLHLVDAPCPSDARSQHPIAVYLVPAIVKHQSMVAIPSREVTLGMGMLACADGWVVGRNVVDEADIRSPTATVNVATHWVLGVWLTGRLPDYADTRRWRVVLLPEA